MNQIPAVGGARGVFEIFVPGLFLLANILAPLYFLPWTRALTRAMIQPLANPVTGVVLLICFGYLLGVLLRVARADTPDDWAGRYLERFHTKAMRFPRLATDPFPYFEWLEESCRHYPPPNALEYFNSQWAPRKCVPERNKPFFNLCKVAAVHTANPIANEIYAAEAMTRYLACMFYALRISLVITLLAGLISFHSTPIRGAGWFVLTALYAITLWVIVRNFKFIRFKEVDTVFTACYVSDIRF